MKKNLILAALAAAVLALAACGSEKEEAPTNVPTQTVAKTATTVPTPTPEPTGTPVPTATQVPTVTVAPTATPIPDTSWYEPMLEDSVVSTGNNARLKRAIEKCKRGEDVYVAMIGGSVTEGAGASSNKKGYAYQFIEAFRKEFAPGNGENVKFVDAGLGGTPSSLGVIRYQRDVVDALTAEPDILFIEFAVNDYQEVTTGRAYEALIRNALMNEKDAAVVLVFAVFKNKWNQQELYIPAGELYELPMVSIRNAIVTPFKENKLSDAKFFSDEYHPTTYGHTIMSDCLMHLMKLVDAEEIEEYGELPQNGYRALDFFGTKMLTEKEEEVVIEKGSFTAVDKSVQGYPWTGKSAFPENFMHDKAAGNESLKLTLTCKNMLLNFKTSSSKEFGTAEVYVDGKKVQTLQGMSSGGWNNSNVVMILDEKEPAEHVIEVKMAEGQEEKYFTVLAIGYSK